MIFAVYNGSGSFRADLEEDPGALLTNAKLDNHTASQTEFVGGRFFTVVTGDDVPANCLTCHGGSARADASNGRISNAFFLPFDLQNFRYSSNNTPFTRASQEEAFRQLNRMVSRTNVPGTMRTLVNGWYANNLNAANMRFDNDYVPTGWRNTDTHPYAEKLYRYVVEPYCQSCHMSQTGALAFNSVTDFVSLKTPIRNAVCGTAGTNAPAREHQMPHAEMTLNNFWRSGARPDGCLQLSASVSS